MGKGDVKSKKGKRFRGSYGVSRKRKSTNTYVAPEKKEKEVKKVVKEAQENENKG